MTTDFLTIGELAQMLKVHHYTVRRLIKSGRIYAVYVGRNVRIPSSEVARIMSEGVEL